MQYKTIVLELIQQKPVLYDQLLASRTLLPMLDRYATAFRACHLYWMEQLSQQNPLSDRLQLLSQALEIATQELHDSLPLASSPEGSITPLSLDGAMAFLNRHMSAG